MDQMATVLSLLAEASQREQGEKCTALTVPVWYRSTASGFHLPHCHTRTRRSQPPVTSSLVSGRTQTCGEQVQPWAQHRVAAERTATCACACARARACTCSQARHSACRICMCVCVYVCVHVLPRRLDAAVLRLARRGDLEPAQRLPQLARLTTRLARAAAAAAAATAAAATAAQR